MRKKLKIGQTVLFDPFDYITNFYGRSGMLGKTVLGTVVYINEDHRWFSVAYNGLRTSFSFSDVGEGVKI